MNRPLQFALGVGLTNACNLSCAHCYRATGNDELDPDDVLRAVDALPTRAVNFGTGENALHPGFAALVGALLERGIDVTMTTNGHSAKALPDELLARFRDVEFSIDYPTKEAHDEARGPGNWDLIAEQMARCSALGVSATIVAVMMATNYRALPELARLADGRGAALRVNVFQSVRSHAFALRYDQFWEGWRLLLGVADLVTCGEPVLRAALAIERAPGAGCGAQTVRVTPRGQVIPCVYGSEGTLGVDDLVALGPDVVSHASFGALRQVPTSCQVCPHVRTCGGGCASRRALRGDLDRPDEYCPIARGRSFPTLAGTFAPSGRAVPKAASACTTIVRLRRNPATCHAPRNFGEAAS